MSQLPKERLEAYHKPFFGPIIVKLSKKICANQAKAKNMELYLHV